MRDESDATNERFVAMMPNYLLQNPDDSRARMFYAIALAELGRKDQAIAEGAAAVDLSPNDSVMLYNGACLYARLGEKQKAIATLREAIAAGVTNFSWMAHDPDLDSLRAEPDFVALFQTNS